MIAVYILLGLVALILIASSLMPKSYNVEKSAIIKKPVKDVMARIGNLNYYRDWNPWMKMEPGASSTITRKPHTPGHKYHWEGKNIGIGELPLRNNDDKHIHLKP